MKSLHKFLRAIGFSRFDTRKKVHSLVKTSAIDATDKSFTSNGEETMFAEYCKDFSPVFGVAVCGELSDYDSKFSYDYYYPYLRTNRISTYEDINVERHASRESYAGICDDVRIGVSLIFYLQNAIDYVEMKNSKRLPVKGTSLCLSALSTEGTIMMPIKKNEKQKEYLRKKSNYRYRLIQAAREGDEKAIESLTLDDMDVYSSISKKIKEEDVFSIVDSYFMPYGVECDQYSILGEILEYNVIKNELTEENVYVMTISCNELVFDLCINEQDIYGEPEVGRRFKGIIWLQGYINFPE